MPLGWYVIQPPLTATIDADVHKVVASLVGDQPYSATQASVLKKLVASAVGSQAQSGAQITTLQKLVASLAGNEVDVYGGSNSTLKKLVAAFVAEHIISGAEATVLRKLTSSLAGEQLLAGVLSGALGKTAFSGNGWLAPSGDMVSTLQKVQANFLQGNLTSGDVVSVLQKVSASLGGSQLLTGTQNTTLVKLAANFVGEQQILGNMAPVLKKTAASFVGEQPYSGAQATTLQKLTALLAGTQAQSGAINMTLAKTVATLNGTQTQSGGMGVTLAKTAASLSGSQSSIPKFATLTETFDTSAAITGGGSVSNGEWVIPCGTSPSFTDAWLTQKYDIINSSVAWEVTGHPANGSNTETGVSLCPSSAYSNSLYFYVWHGQYISGYWNDAALGGGDHQVFEIPYDPVAHRWWRIRESSGTCYWDTSPDGTNWTNQASAATPAIPLNNLYFDTIAIQYAGSEAPLKINTIGNPNPLFATLKKVAATLAGSQIQSGAQATTLAKTVASLNGTHTAVGATGDMASVLQKATDAFSGIIPVEPNQIEFDADWHNIGTLPTGSLIKSGHKIGYANPGTTVTPRIRLSGHDSDQVLTFDENSAASTSLYAFIMDPTSTTTALVPVSDDICYVSFKYREVSWGSFTTAPSNFNSCVICGAWTDVNSFSTTDTPTHMKHMRDQMLASQYTDGSESAIAIEPNGVGTADYANGKVTGLTDPGNGWRTVRMVLVKGRGLIVHQDWNGTTRAFSLRGARDWDTRFPFFEWYVANLSNVRRFELKALKGASTSAVQANSGWLAWVNQILAAAGESDLTTAPIAITQGSSYLDLFTGPDTPNTNAAIKGTLGPKIMTPAHSAVSGNVQFMIRNSNNAQGGWNNWDSGCAYPGKVFPGNNQRIRGKIINNSSIHMLPLSLGDDGGVVASYWNSNVCQIMTMASNQLGSRTARVNGPSLTYAANDDLEFDCVGRSYIIKKNGIYQCVWTDTGNLRSRDASHCQVGVNIYSTAAGQGYQECEWTPLPDNHFVPQQATKSGGTWPATTTTFVQVTGWTKTNTTTYLGLPLSSDKMKIYGTKTAVPVSISIPYTGSTSGRAHQARLVRVSDSAVVATSNTASTGTSGTCTISTNLDFTSEEEYRVEVNCNGSGPGTIGSATWTFG